LIDDLCRAEFARAGAVVARAGHRPALPAHLQAAGDTLRARLKAKPFDPPSRKELACDAVSLRALRFLVESGEAVELSADVVIAAIDLKRATELTQAFIRARGPATVSDLRQMLGSSRRVVVPLLEHLDRAGVTLRQGDKRSLRSP
jgi:selenocysteine-specific elongation factor